MPDLEAQLERELAGLPPVEWMQRLDPVTVPAEYQGFLQRQRRAHERARRVGREPFDSWVAGCAARLNERLEQQGEPEPLSVSEARIRKYLD